jgi:hypothetical protein
MPSKPRAFFACLLAAAALAACGKSDPAKSQPPSPGAGSRPASVVGSDQVPIAEALFDTVYARVRRGDTVGLARLLVDDSTFRRNVYPVSPAYDSSSESVFEFVLGFHKTNSAKGLKRLLRDAQDSGLAVLRVPNADTVKTPEGVLYVLPEYSGARPGLQLYGSVLCRPSGCQVVSYAPAGARGG